MRRVAVVTWLVILLGPSSLHASPIFSEPFSFNTADSKGRTLTVHDEDRATIENFDLKTANYDYGSGPGPDPVRVKDNSASQTLRLDPTGFSWVGDARAESTIVVNELEQSGGCSAGFIVKLVLPEEATFVIAWTAQTSSFSSPEFALASEASLLVYDLSNARTAYQIVTSGSIDIRTEFVTLPAGNYEFQSRVGAYFEPDPAEQDWYHTQAHVDLAVAVVPEPASALLALMAALGWWAICRAAFVGRCATRSRS